jgi:MFS superfamily sulfate permease-like transporter
LPASYIEQKRDEQRNESVFKKVKTRIPYYIPILSWLPKYNVKEDLVKDIVAGLGVSAMLIPQSLAYAILAGLPPNIGLYTAFVRNHIKAVSRASGAQFAFFGLPLSVYFRVYPQ